MIRKKLSKKESCITGGAAFSGWMGEKLPVLASTSTTASGELDAAEDILGGLSSLVNLILAGLAVVGVIFIVLGVADLSAALNSRDNSGVYTAALKIISGVIMTALGAVLGFMGVKW